MYHRKYFCKHSANARQYVSGKRGVVVAGIGNVKGSAAPAAIGLQLWSGSDSTTWTLRALRGCTSAQVLLQYALMGVWGGSNYQLNLLADQSRGLNFLQNAPGCGKLNNFDLHSLLALHTWKLASIV